MMVLRRCKKLTYAVMHIQTIFRLIERRNKLKLVDRRLMCAIKAFLVEHTLFPVKFTYNGTDILEKIKFN